MAKVNKYSIHGLKRRPTYDEIIGMLDDNEKITGKLPNRDATFFKNSPEGSFFDGSDAMEQLKEEQGKLLLRQMSEILLRQNVRTAGRTFHTERLQQLPTTSPVIAQPTQPMNVDEEMAQQVQATPTMPSSSTAQASQLNAELTQRQSTATKRREERVGNCLGILFFLVWGFFFGFPVLTIFHAICSILELETAISTVCATVLSSNLSFSIVFSTVFATVCSMFCPFSMLFAAFLSWNLHFHRMCNILQLHSSQYLQDFGAEG